MKKKLMAVLLTLCMAITMFPMSVLAANTADDLAVSGYGFVWNADGKTPAADSTLLGGGTVGKDWMGQTMYVVFKEAVPAGTNLWFQVTVGEEVWGCAAQGKGTSNTYAFSFLNRNKQWEQLPESRKEETEVTATGLADGNKATLKVFTTDSLLTAAPTADLGTALFTKEIAITSGKDVQETVAQDTPVEGALTFGEVPANTNIFGKKPADMGKFEIKQDTTKITVTGSANYIADYTEFNTAVVAEQKGHYLPIQIKGTKDQVITITNKSTGAESGKEMTFGDDGSFEMAVWLDGERAADAKKEFRVATGEGDAAVTYTVNFADVVLLPKAEVKDNTTKVEVSDKEVDSLENLLKGDSTATPDANAPVKVEESGADKTLTFTGKNSDDGSMQTGTAVTLPSALVGKLTQSDTKADVKVESSAGTVKLPSETLTGVTDPVTVSIKGATGTETTLDGKTIEPKEGATLTDGDKSAISAAIKDSQGVSVDAKKNGSDPLVEASNTSVIEVVINGLDANKTYILLCVNGTKVTSFGEYTGKTSHIIRTKHLTDWYAVDVTAATDATKAALAKIAPDAGKVEETPTPSGLMIAFTAASNSIGPKATVTGLTANGTATVQIAGAANKAPAVIFTMQADAAGEIEFNVNANSVVTVWNGAVTFTNGQPSAGAPASTTATAK